MIMKKYKLFVFLSIFATLIVLTVACESKEEKERKAYAELKEKEQKAWSELQDAVSSLLKNSQGVANAPSYYGGPVPHKLDYWENFDFKDCDLLPDEWIASSISELQLCLKITTTKIPTGRTQEYKTVGTEAVSTAELLHQTWTLTLMEARTAKVIATKVIEGDGRFPDSVSSFGWSVPDKVSDSVDTSSVREWLRPYVVNQAVVAEKPAEETRR